MVRLFILVILLLCNFNAPSSGAENLSSEKTNTSSKTPTAGTNTIKNIPNDIPSVVNKTVSNVGSPLNTNHTENQDKKEDKGPDESWWYKLRTDPVSTFTFLLFIATGLLWWSTRQLVIGAERASTKELRAYLSVSIGSGIYQERDVSLRFEVKPMLINSGRTPAHKITYWAKAAILPVPLPADFPFPSVEDKVQSSYVLGPSQSIELNAMVEDYVADTEVEDIKRGNGKSPYIWGIVSYTDVFGISHITKFCHSIRWVGPIGKEIIYGTYATKHNEAT